jgi:hypothetical protein
MIRIPAGVEPCRPFGDVPADAWSNKRTLEPAVNEIIVRSREPVNEIISRSQAEKLSAARAELAAIGAPAIEPAPLVDTTQVRGRGRPKLTAEAAQASKDAEKARRRVWMAAKRKAKASQV